MNNTTLLLLQQNEKFKLPDNYDSTGAIIFIVGVLLWYSLSIVFLLGMHTIAPTEIVEYSSRNSRLFTQNFREKTNNKKVLEELGDKEKRDKLWDIYLGTSGDMSDKITRAETLRIRNIQRQLATINEHYRDDNECIRFSNDDNSLDFNVASSVPDISSSGTRLRVRRQSSMDQQILEEWKTTVDGLKIRENWPWAIQRLLIRRHLRRQRQTKEYRSLRKTSIP